LKRSICLYESSARGALSEDNFTEDSESYTKEGSGKGASVSTGTPLGARKGCCFTWDFERKVKYFFYREILFTGDSKKYVKGDCGKAQLSLYRLRWRSWGGLVSPGTLSDI